MRLRFLSVTTFITIFPTLFIWPLFNTRMYIYEVCTTMLFTKSFACDLRFNKLCHWYEILFCSHYPVLADISFKFLVVFLKCSKVDRVTVQRRIWCSLQGYFQSWKDFRIPFFHIVISNDRDSESNVQTTLLKTMCVTTIQTINRTAKYISLSGKKSEKASRPKIH